MSNVPRRSQQTPRSNLGTSTLPGTLPAALKGSGNVGAFGGGLHSQNVSRRNPAYPGGSTAEPRRLENEGISPARHRATSRGLEPLPTFEHLYIGHDERGPYYRGLPEHHACSRCGSRAWHWLPNDVPICDPCMNAKEDAVPSWRPKHLSVSAVELYAACPAAYEARYVKKMADDPTPQMAFGRVIHKALEVLHGAADMESGMDDAERVLIAEWNYWNTALGLSGNAMAPGKAYALALLDEYRSRGLADVRGTPEWKFFMPLPGGKIPVPVMGFLDLVMPNGFRDYKTTAGKSWTEAKVQGCHQLHLYGWAYQRAFRHRPEVAEFVILGTRVPTLEVIRGEPSPDGLRLFEYAAEAAWAGITEGRFDPCAKASCWFCKRQGHIKTKEPKPAVSLDMDEEAVS